MYPVERFRTIEVGVIKSGGLMLTRKLGEAILIENIAEVSLLGFRDGYRGEILQTIWTPLGSRDRISELLELRRNKLYELDGIPVQIGYTRGGLGHNKVKLHLHSTPMVRIFRAELRPDR